MKSPGSEGDPSRRHVHGPARREHPEHVRIAGAAPQVLHPRRPRAPPCRGHDRDPLPLEILRRRLGERPGEEVAGAPPEWPTRRSRSGGSGSRHRPLTDRTRRAPESPEAPAREPHFRAMFVVPRSRLWRPGRGWRRTVTPFADTLRRRGSVGAEPPPPDALLVSGCAGRRRASPGRAQPPAPPRSGSRAKRPPAANRRSHSGAV